MRKYNNLAVLEDEKQVEKRHRIIDLFFLCLVVFTIGSNYFKSGFPITAEANYEFFSMYLLKKTIIENLSIISWDMFGGCPLYGFHPFIGSLSYFVSISLFIPDLIIGIKLAIILGLFLMIISMYFLILLLTKNHVGSIAGGLFFGFNIYIMIDIVVHGHVNYLASYIIFPLLILSIENAIAKNEIRNCIISALIYGVCLILDPQMGVVYTGFIFIYAFFRGIILIEKKSIKCKGVILETAKKIAIIFILGILISAYVILTWFDLKNQVVFKNYPLSHAVKYSLSFIQAISLYPILEPCAKNNFYLYTHVGHYWYLGLILFSIYFNRSKRNICFFSVFMAGIILSMGMNFPLIKMCYKLIPALRIFHVPSRFLILSVAFSSILIGDAVGKMAKILKNKNYFGIGNLLLFSLVLLGFIFTINSEKFSRDYRADDLKKWTNGVIVDDVQSRKHGAIYNGAISGPYETYFKGDYEVRYRMKVDDNSRTDGVAGIDITTAGAGKVFIRKEIKGIDFAEPNKYQDFVLPLNLEENTGLEFRVHYYGKCNLWIESVRVKGQIQWE